MHSQFQTTQMDNVVYIILGFELSVLGWLRFPCSRFSGALVTFYLKMEIDGEKSTSELFDRLPSGAK
jgi:hypothetical protein